MSGVEQANNKLCIKFGGFVQLSETATLRYLRNMTTIPVPKVYCAFRRWDRTFILIEHIDGEPIGKNWASRSKAENKSLILQLKNVLIQMRSIPHPRPGTLATADMQPLYDPRCWKGYLGFGPVANESDSTTIYPVEWTATLIFSLKNMLRGSHPKSGRICVDC